MEKTYRLFISHSWAYGDAYEKIINMLKKEGINFYDHSVPKNDPLHTKGTAAELRNAIDAQMKCVSGVLIMAGVYSTYSKWINEEIAIAKKYGKPIIAIEPWGSEKTSAVVKNCAFRVVGWNSASIAKAVRELC